MRNENGDRCAPQVCTAISSANVISSASPPRADGWAYGAERLIIYPNSPSVTFLRARKAELKEEAKRAKAEATAARQR